MENEESEEPVSPTLLFAIPDSRFSIADLLLQRRKPGGFCPQAIVIPL
jgi:hypothetical protein